MSKQEQIDVLCVGDVVTDVFIKLIDALEHTYKNEDGKWLAIPFGMKIPFDHAETLHAVGNAANAAVSFSRLGLNAAFKLRSAATKKAEKSSGRSVKRGSILASCT
ncbi:hypothetical protein IPL68_07910 [Candidatus Saccharibacteria bacterium]|nr:MAG: hypothetical protein IPL68_07910 [Candidatus Saccharibacteria bacterium]